MPADESAVPSEKEVQLAKIREALVRKAEVLYRCVRRAAEEGVIDTIEAVVPQLRATLAVVEFPGDRRREIDENVRQVTRNAYMRSVEVSLFQAERASRDGDAKGRNTGLAIAKDHFMKAVRLGADDDFRAAVEKRVQTCLLTSSRGVDGETKELAARRLEARDRNAGHVPDGRERRRALRYVVPPLAIDIEGVIFETANWSQVGLLIDGFTGKPPLKVGDKVKVGMACAGIVMPDRQVARVVRILPGRRQVALEFPDISTLILDLIAAMKRLGMVPRVR